jgi:Holliday junction resolvase RusA-like endonuclease
MDATIAKTRKPKPDLKPLPPIERFIAETRRLVAGDGWHRICLPYPPSINHMYGLGVIGNRAIKFLDKEGKRYHKFVADMSLVLGTRAISGDVQILIEVYRPQKSGDLDNIFKAVLDSVKGICWVDDSQVCGICANRHEDANFPRVVLALRTAIGETLNFEEFFK